MSMIILPNPLQSPNININVGLVGDPARIGFFDANGMVLDSTFQTFVNTATDLTCSLQFTLVTPNMMMFVHAKELSPLTAWMPSQANTVVTQTASIGPNSNPAGIMSSFNIAVAEAWESPDAYWMDPTWPLGQVGSGGPKSIGAPANSASYFYLPSLGAAAAPQTITLYANVAVYDGTGYTWLSNVQGICAGTSLVLCPPTGAAAGSNLYSQITIHAGTMPTGYSVTVEVDQLDNMLPYTVPLTTTVGTSTQTTATLKVSYSGATVSSTPITCHVQADPPGPIWTNP